MKKISFKALGKVCFVHRTAAHSSSVLDTQAGCHVDECITWIISQSREEVLTMDQKNCVNIKIDLFMS